MEGERVGAPEGPQLCHASIHRAREARIHAFSTASSLSFGAMVSLKPSDAALDDHHSPYLYLLSPRAPLTAPGLLTLVFTVVASPTTFLRALSTKLRGEVLLNGALAKRDLSFAVAPAPLPTPLELPVGSASSADRGGEPPSVPEERVERVEQDLDEAEAGAGGSAPAPSGGDYLDTGEGDEGGGKKRARTSGGDGHDCGAAKKPKRDDGPEGGGGGAASAGGAAAAASGDRAAREGGGAGKSGGAGSAQKGGGSGGTGKASSLAKYEVRKVLRPSVLSFRRIPLPPLPPLVNAPEPPSAPDEPAGSGPPDQTPAPSATPTEPHALPTSIPVVAHVRLLYPPVTRTEYAATAYLAHDPADGGAHELVMAKLSECAPEFVREEAVLFDRAGTIAGVAPRMLGLFEQEVVAWPGEDPGEKKCLMVTALGGKALEKEFSELAEDQKHDLYAVVLALHRKAGILHGDLAPRNVLLDEDGRLRLCDFGVAVMHACPGEGECRELCTLRRDLGIEAVGEEREGQREQAGEKGVTGA
ncbi:hypothetical protein JCM10450v2_007076 [Rhodotorula kratochvilovae]